MSIVSASVLPMVLKAAAELGVLDIIEKAGPCALLSHAQISSQLVTENQPETPSIIDRIVRLLTRYSILTCSLTLTTPVAIYFLRNQEGGSLALLLELIPDKTMLNMWHHLKDTVLEGGLPFSKAYGMNAVEYIGKDAKMCKIFKGSMRDFNPLFIQRILENYKGFEGQKSLVDVVGGDGSILNEIISKYPAVVNGIEHVAGDMFVHIQKGEAIFMKWILHSWQLGRRALLEDSEKLLCSITIQWESDSSRYGNTEVPDASLAAKSLFQLVLFMMNMNSRGKERTRREFDSLAKAAGFSRIQVPCCAYNFSVVEFYKSM